MKVHHAECDLEPVDRTDAADDAFRNAALLAIAGELDRIRLLVHPAERIAGKNLVPDFREVTVDEQVDAIVRIHPEMVPAFGADIVVGREVATIEHFTAFRALRPERCITRIGVLSAAAQQPVRNRHGFSCVPGRAAPHRACAAA